MHTYERQSKLNSQVTHNITTSSKTTERKTNVHVSLIRYLWYSNSRLVRL